MTHATKVKKRKRGRIYKDMVLYVLWYAIFILVDVLLWFLSNDDYFSIE